MKQLRTTLVAAVLLLAGIGWLLLPDWMEDGIPPSVHTRPLAERIEAGRYLARAGNCVACHTAQGGPEYAGGRRIGTPFGAIYSTNLTPDPATGLGDWTEQDFYRALHHGRSRDGRRLYPAFPYPNYTQVTRRDADAIFAYLQSLPPVRRATPPPELRFPYNTQLALMVWRALYFDPAPAQAGDGGLDTLAAGERGAYLVEGLGHCNACHTARGPLGGLRAGADYDGGPIPSLNWDALPLTREAPMSDADAAQMRSLLSTGVSARGAVSGPMAEVVFHSLQYLRDDDIAAMVDYLRRLPRRTASTMAPVRAAVSPDDPFLARGATLYRTHCRDCHGDDGQGRPFAIPALAGNPLVTAASPNNAIQSVLFGGFAPSTAGNPRPYGMPPYAHRLNDTELAAVLSYIRASWGNAAPAVAPAEVRRR